MPLEICNACVYYIIFLVTFNSQRSNLLNQARLTTLKAQDDHIKVSDAACTHLGL